MLSDIRYALRSLAANPGFTFAAVLTLALGIGANAAIFTVVYGVLLKPLPYAQPDRLMRIGELRQGLPWNVAYPNFLDWRARNHVFADMAIFNTIGSVVVGGDATGASVAPMGTAETRLFSVMGVAAARGRLFNDDDARPSASVGVVISDRVWRQVFGGDPAVVGSAVEMNNQPVTVLGVLPAGVRPYSVDVWFPMRALSPMQLMRANHPGFFVVARLRDGIMESAARREMTSIAESLAREYPASNRDMSVSVTPLLDSIAGGIRPTLLMLLGAVGVLLLIACANVANLMLARGLRRERETSIRSALGATRWRLVRCFFVEGLTLGALGAVAGLLLAAWGVRLLGSVPGLTLPRAADVAIDPHVLGFAAVLAALTAALFALAPALQFSRVDLMRILRQAGAGDGARPQTSRLRAGLVAAEVGLLVVLLVSAVLMQRTLANLAGVDPGFRADRLLSVPLVQRSARYDKEGVVEAFATALVGSVKGQPGVAAAALAWPFDYTGSTWGPSVNLPDHPFPPGSEPDVQAASVTPEYFETMGIPVIKGRTFGSAERLGAPVSVIVNQTFATRFFRGEDPLGKRVSAMRIPLMQNMSIVGVVGDTRRGGMLRGFTPEIYVAFAQFAQSGATLVVRAAAGDPLRLQNDIKARVATLDSGTAMGTVKRLDDQMAASYGDRRALSWLLGVFAALALGLTGLGIASVVSFTVAQRTSEIGIRIALGANSRDVVSLIVTGALYPVAAGALAGAAALVPISRTLRSYLFGMSAADPVSLSAAAGVLLIAAVLAAYVPARRAATVDPLIALRSS